MISFNPFVLNAPFLYPLKTSENLTVFSCFQGVEKEYIRNEWFNCKIWFPFNKELAFDRSLICTEADCKLKIISLKFSNFKKRKIGFTLFWGNFWSNIYIFSKLTLKDTRADQGLCLLWQLTLNSVSPLSNWCVISKLHRHNNREVIMKHSINPWIVKIHWTIFLFLKNRFHVFGINMF